MPTREPKDDGKKPVKTPPRTNEQEEKHEAHEGAGLDPLADEHPSICRGID